MHSLTVAAFLMAPAKPQVLLQTRQKLWSHSATWMVSPSCHRWALRSVVL